MSPNNFLGNNNNALPWPADSLNRNPIPINIENPPFVPNVPCTPDFQQVLPLVTGSAIQEIQQGAQTTNLRAFAFNQLSENNYQNQEFVNLVSLIVSIMMYSVYVQKQSTQLGQLVQLGVQKGIEYQLASNVAQYPALQSYLDVNAQNYVRTVLNELQQIRPQLQNMMAQLSGGGGMGMQNNRPSFSTNNFGASNGAGAGVFQQNPIRQPIQAQQTNNTSFGSKYGNIKAPEAPINTNPIPVSANTLIETKPDLKEDVTVPTPVSKSPLKWKRTEEQPYPPLVKRSEHELFVQLNEQGVPTLSIGKRTENSMFDYETHTTLTNFGVRASTKPLPTSEDISKTNKELTTIISNGIEKVNKDTETVPELKIIKHGYSFVEYSLESFCLENELSRAGYIEVGKAGQIKLFKTEGFLIENLGELTERDRLDLAKLKTSESFEELAVILKNAAATMSKRPWRIIERKLTRTLNDVLKYQLSLELSIDSFLLDIDDLMGVLKKTSTAVHESITKNQINIIRHALAPISGTDLEAVVKETILTNEINDKEYTLKFEFLQNEVTVTSVDIDSETLDIELFGTVGNIILPSESKLLLSLAESIIKDKGINSNPVGLDYIMLSDGTILRISKGLIGEDYYIVSIVN